MKQQAVIEGDGEVGREREGWSMGEQPQSPAQGSGGGILHRGEHSRMQGRAATVLLYGRFLGQLPVPGCC